MAETLPMEISAMPGKQRAEFDPRPALTIPAMLSLLSILRFEAEADDVLGDFAAILGVAIDHLTDLRAQACSVMQETDDAPFGELDEVFDELASGCITQSRPRRLC